MIIQKCLLLTAFCLMLSSCGDPFDPSITSNDSFDGIYLDLPSSEVLLDEGTPSSEVFLDGNVPCIPQCGNQECGLDHNCGKKDCGTCSWARICQSEVCAPPPLGEYKVECGSDNMCLIPAGPFWMGMGCAYPVLGCSSSFHEVTLSAYYIDKTEVTRDKYAECLTAGVCTGSLLGCFGDDLGGRDVPIDCLDWFQADAYCTWAGKRLPTEAEWEKAARGTDGRIYPWGDETPNCDYAIMEAGFGEGCGTDRTWPVCSKSPTGDSPYGLCDMAGNVQEWVADWYKWDYYEISPDVDPKGPSWSKSQVEDKTLRGGTLYDYQTNLRSDMRFHIYPEASSGGFRCARSE